MPRTLNKPVGKEQSPQAVARRKRAWAALCALRDQARRTGVDKMTMRQIDAEVAAARRRNAGQ